LNTILEVGDAGLPAYIWLPLKRFQYI